MTTRFSQKRKKTLGCRMGDGNQTGAILNLGGAVAVVLQAILSVIFSIFGVLASLMSALPVILIGLGVTLAMLPWVVYHDSIIEQVELAARGTIYPIWRDYIREIVVFLREIYDPLICWWNALNWWGYGMVREVLLPTIRECGIRPLFQTAGSLVQSIGHDIVLFIASGRFLTEFADFSRITPRGIAFFQAWINLYYCACHDLADIVFVIPILTPLIVTPLAPIVFFSGQWLDPYTWCVIEKAFNGTVAAVQEGIRLATQVLNLLAGTTPPGTVFIRPDLRRIIDKACPLIECAVRLTENGLQTIWDRYIPFKFIFKDYLCIVSSIACIALKTIGLAFRLLINIDRAVVYPADLFWEDVIKPDMLEILNLGAAPTAWPTVLVPRPPSALRYVMINYFYDPASENTPLGRPNPIFGKKRLTECACTLIQRTICDPADVNTGCYSSTAQNLLMGLDFCCLTNSVLVLAVDLVSGLIEFTMHLSKGPDDFFLFVDAQPFTTVLQQDLVIVARCVFSFFGLIPVVGPCLRELFTSIVAYILEMVDFSIRVLVGLLTLPYFYIVLPGTGNFVSQPNLALNFFVSIHEAVIADIPGSIKNCLCVILNNGFPVPPIPCSSCVVGGYVAAPAHRRHKLPVMYDKETGELTSPLALMQDTWGIPRGAENGAEYAMTPMIRYHNHTTNPIELYNLLWNNAKRLDVKTLPFQNMDDLNVFIDQKKDALMDKWARIRACGAKHAEARHLAMENRKLYEYRRKTGEYSCDPDEPITPYYQRPTTLMPSVFRMSINTNETRESRNAHDSYTEAPTEHQQQDRLTLGPTIPPLIGCDPKPPCFDLCCIIRSTLILIVHIIEMLARFMNGLIQGSTSQQGTMQDYPYFTGEFATLGQPTFESDFVGLILKLFVPIKCACQVFNLIIPVSPSAFSKGRQDICCFVQRLSELIACIFMVILQAINALAMGSKTGYIYFKDTTMFMKDVSTLFDITLAVVDCLCILARAIFPLDYIPGFADATNFDICCLAQAILVTVIEALRTVLQIVLSIALIGVEENMGGSSAFCFWRLDQVTNHNCAGTLDGIGIIKQLDVVIDSFLPRHGEQNGACLQVCKSDNGATGIVPCLCQIFNTLIPFRDHPDKKTNCDPNPATKNCPILDFCCPFAKLGFAIADALKFLTRASAALWQSWDGGLPEFFVNYVWCDEGRIPPCTEKWYKQQQIPIDNFTMFTGGNFLPDQCTLQQFKKVPNCVGVRPVLDNNNTIVYKCGEYTCGKVNIIIDDLVNPNEGLLAKCLCQVFSLLDFLLAYIFHYIQIAFPFAGWPCCFCGGFNSTTGQCAVNKVDPCVTEYTSLGKSYNGSSGVLPAISYVIASLLKAVTRLLRAFPLYCYWNPNGDLPPSKISQTWIFSFLAPTADAICIASGNLVCFAQSMFFLPRLCLTRGEKFLGGIARWVFEVIFRVIGFIEAFVQSFIHPQHTCIGPSCDQKAGSKEQSASVGGGSGSHSVTAKPLGSMLVILLSIPIDLLIGDGDVACTTICPSVIGTVPPPKPCDCWNISPQYAGNPSLNAYQFSTTGCVVQHVRANDSMTVTSHVGEDYGDTSGCCISYIPQWSKPNPLPVCQSVDDISTLSPYYPGSCTSLAACRPDALPSAANDPETPPNLSANYKGALDGIVMALVRYMRCLLDNIVGCNAMGEMCLPFGLILYPAILIFSISWQILGGVIKFLAACLIFFFSLFTPPDGNGCSCWQSGQTDGFDQSRTRMYRQVGGLCYPCQTLDVACDSPVNFQTVSNQGCSMFQYKCAAHCPVWQHVSNPTWTDAQAHAQCLLDYANLSNKHFPYIQKKPGTTAYDVVLSAEIVCSGIKPFATTVWQQVGPGTTPANKTWGSFNTTNAVSGWCYPPAQWGGGDDVGGTSWTNYVVLDACPAPACQTPSVTKSVCGVDAYGLWPCGAHQQPFGPGELMFDCTYPANSLVTCGALQIISNLIDIFASFVQIFTTPILIPNKREVSLFDRLGSIVKSASSRFSGPARRESIQKFKARFDGAMYGLEVDGANYAEVVTAALYDYDTSDCYTDPLTCHCRNLDMPDHCHFDDSTGAIVFGPLGKKRDGGNGTMTADDLPNMMSTQMFTGTTVCDHVMGDHANKTWDEIVPDQKNQYMKCLDKMIQGTRMNHVTGNVVPVDIMYNSQGPMTVMHNIFHKAKRSIKSQHERKTKTRVSGREQLELRFPKFDEQLRNRSLFAQRILINDYGITPQKSMVFDAAVKADRIWFKYTTGYYNFLVENMLDGIANGDSILPTKEEALRDVHHALLDLKRVVIIQQYGDVVSATVNATRMVSREIGAIFDEGVIEFVTRTYNQYADSRKRAYARTDAGKANQFSEALRASPLYRWWYAEPYPMSEEERFRRSEPTVGFGQHMSNIVAFQRAHWQTESFNFFNADLKFWSMADVIRSRFSNPVWEPHQLENLEKLKRAYYQTYHRIWPGSLTNEQKERFLFNSNCVIADRMVNLTIKVVDYCANEAIPNLSTRSGPGASALRSVGAYFSDVSRYREDTYYGYKNRARITEERSAPSDEGSWIRPRLILPNSTAPNSHSVDYRVYRRSSLTQKQHGPAKWNLFYWLISVIEDVTGFALTAQTDTWYTAVKAWITNPNTDVADYPNVGLAYAVRFEFVCHFPESLNCSIGVGFETAFLWVSVGFLVLTLVAGYALPPLMIPFTILGLGTSYVIVLVAVAWHYPAACAMLFPSFPLPFGIALPECAVDQLLAFLDKWVTNCYSPLIIPAYMISGDVCPTDPQQTIDFLNCADVGVSDGIQNLLYLGFWLLGTGFTDFVMQVGGVFLGPFIPGVQVYLDTTLASFKNANPTDRSRMTFCFYATLPTIFLPAIFIFIVGMFAAIVLPQVLLLINSLVTLLFASPVAAALPGGGDASDAWFGENSDTVDESKLDDLNTLADYQKDPASVSSWFKWAMYGSLGKTKEKTE
jgi:hypothetical protein